MKVQGPTPDSAVIDFHTKIGSFKILSNSQDVKARGKLDMEFQGTVLVIGLEGTATPNGALKVQYDDQTHGRKAFFGQGRLTVEGKWRAIQFFGRNVKATWDGMGVLRVNGEFDDKLDTGSYQIRGYGGKEAWGNGGREVRIPPPSSAPRVKPKIVDVPTNPKLPS
ncbi:hypothetical protein EON77_04950 [bacterium]|nr:MAG: hypothetical protein EON77_04950 [bacterium]